jgi:hypothetical protein
MIYLGSGSRCLGLSRLYYTTSPTILSNRPLLCQTSCRKSNHRRTRVDEIPLTVEVSCGDTLHLPDMLVLDGGEQAVQEARSRRSTIRKTVAAFSSHQVYYGLALGANKRGPAEVRCWPSTCLSICGLSRPNVRLLRIGAPFFFGDSMHNGGVSRKLLHFFLIHSRYSRFLLSKGYLRPDMTKQ